jgi:glyoxylase I family protein
MPERRQVLLFLAAASCATMAAGNNAEVGAPMEKVLGIGGFFFRSADPKALAAWYNDHLGVAPIPSDYHAQPWQQEAGPTAFAPFPRDTKYFGADTQMFMLNFRVRDLDKMAAQLLAKGITVKIDPETYPNGRFAHLHDPDGNPIELWQPK